MRPANQTDIVGNLRTLVSMFDRRTWAATGDAEVARDGEDGEFGSIGKRVYANVAGTEKLRIVAIDGNAVYRKPQGVNGSRRGHPGASQSHGLGKLGPAKA